MKVNVRAMRILGSLATALLLAALGATPGAAQTTGADRAGPATEALGGTPDIDRAMGVGGPTGLPSPGGPTGVIGPTDTRGTKGSLDGIKPKAGTKGSLDGIMPKAGTTGTRGAVIPFDSRATTGTRGAIIPIQRPGKTGVVTPSMRPPPTGKQ